jgi:2'-5' RNA ligase
MILNENRFFKKGCLMAYVDPTYGPRIASTGKRIIPPQILYNDDEDPTFGYSDEPHVTIKYGFEPDINKTDVIKILKGVTPFYVKLKALNQFQNEKYDVVKFEVEKHPLLMELRRRCDTYPNTDSYPDYIPHMTLGYVKKGTFSHIREGLNITLPITRFKYSGKSKSYFINL